jgi:hypothetical protein
MFAPPKGARLCSFFKQRVQESDVEKERVMLVGFVPRAVACIMHKIFPDADARARGAL